MRNLDNEKQIIDMAISGNQEALETIVLGIQNMVFNLFPEDVGNDTRLRGCNTGDTDQGDDPSVVVPSG